jgi:hypothetical protein
MTDGNTSSGGSPIDDDDRRRTDDSPSFLSNKPLCISDFVVASTPLKLVVRRVKFIVLTRKRTCSPISMINSSLLSSPYFHTQREDSALYSDGACNKYDGIKTSSKNSRETKIPSFFDDEIRPVKIYI